MAGAAGTLELLARELGVALSVLEARLGSGGAQAFFAELGLQPPDALVAHSGVATAVEAAASVAGDLPDLVAQLTAAISADDLTQIVIVGGQLLGKIGDVLGAVDGAADAVTVAATAVGGLTPAQRAAIQAFAAELPVRVLGFVAGEYAHERAPTVTGALDALGLVERTPEPGDSADPLRPPYNRREIHLDRVPELLRDPGAHLQSVYHWGEPGFDGIILFEKLQRFMEDSLKMPAVLLRPAGQPAILEAYLFALRVDPTTTPPSLVADIRFPGTQTFTRTYPIRAPWQLEVTASGTFVADVQARLTPPLQVELDPPGGTVDIDLDVSLAAVAPAGSRLLIVGAAGGTRLEAARIGLSFGFDAGWDAATGLASAVPEVGLGLEDGRLVISFGGADGFLDSVLPSALEVEVGLTGTWNPDDGLVLQGGAALAITLPLSVELGPVRLDRLDLRLAITAAGLALETRVAGGIALGPFGASVEGIGAGADLALRAGNLGPVDVGFRFLPPTGLGLDISAGPISGGGFIGFDEAAGRYSGVFQISVGPVGVTAIALLDTRLPGGQSGFALLVVLRGQFPPIQIGFGFALSSVGGLLALNRRIDVDALRSRMATGTAGRILAPEDPVRNAPVLLADLAAVFPPTPGVVVVGPTLQLSWVELVRFDIGIFVELPGPTKIVLLGSARVVVPNPAGGRAYLQLRMDIVGLLDFSRQVLEFDAVLVDSHILEIFELTGGAGFRQSWGAEPYVVLTVGGFHPAYSPSPLVFPASLTRVGMTRGSPTDFLYLRFEGYFAVTTNSLQFGASVEVIINAGPFNARGFLGFDALIRFQPFSFQVDFKASVKVRYRSHTLGGVSLRGTLTGPGPIVFRGKACIEILFFDICWEQTITLGSSTPPAITPVPSAVAELLEELEDPATLRASDALDPYVAVEPPATSLPLPVVSPKGQLIWSQERAPLDLLLQRFEGAPLTTAETVTATGAQVTGAEVDWFAPGSFTDLDDAGALNRRGFERLRAGVRLGLAGTADGPARIHVVTIQQIRLPAPPQPVIAIRLPSWLLRGVAGRNGATERDAVVPATAVRDEAWVVHGAGGGVVASGLSQAQAHQLATVGRAGVAVAASDRVPAFTL